MVEAATSSSVYAVVASWLTPSCLFIFINLVIGTIAVTSRFATSQRKQQRGDDPPGQLARSPSLLDRVMSFNLGHYEYKYQPPTESEFDADSVQTSDSSRLVRGESFLDRVRSFKLGLSKTEKQEDPCPNADDDPTREGLTRRPSLLERLRSMKFYRSGSIKEEREEPGPESEPEVSGNGQRGRYSRKWEGEEEEEEGVDKRADDFINRFKQQLRLQRLDSILRRRDMLKGN